jgi:aspartyl protease family protein
LQASDVYPTLASDQVQHFGSAVAKIRDGFYISEFTMDFRHSIATIILGLLVSAGVGATDVTVAGLFPNKALVQIDGGALRTLSVGQRTPEGVVLVSVGSDTATFDVQGRRMTLGLGHARLGASSSAAASVMLTADTQGHFIADGEVNGIPMRFVVDTGATLITLPASEARRLSLDYRKGQKGMTSTANGTAPAYRIKLDTVRVGDVTINNVDAVVMERVDGLSSALLGMSFLNRMDMKREGDVMTLTKRY